MHCFSIVEIRIFFVSVFLFTMLNVHYVTTDDYIIVIKYQELVMKKKLPRDLNYRQDTTVVPAKNQRMILKEDSYKGSALYTN